MENLWVYLTLLAATLQVTRNSLQKKLKENLDDVSVTWSRFLFSLPVILCLLIIIFPKYQSEILHFDAKFTIFCLLASITQIIGTVLLVKLFSYRNFLVGISYMKTETLQTAIIGTLLFSEVVSFAGIMAILIGTLGLIFLSPFTQKKNQKLSKTILDKSALIGLLCGLFYSFSALFIKQALNVLNVLNFDRQIISVILVLIYMNLIQNFMILAYRLYQKDLKIRLNQMIKNWHLCLTVGFFSVSGSFCWFFAFALVNVAYVKVVGQFEILLSILISRMFFKEKISKYELIGILFILCGILVIYLI